MSKKKILIASTCAVVSVGATLLTINMKKQSTNQNTDIKVSSTKEINTESFEQNNIPHNKAMFNKIEVREYSKNSALKFEKYEPIDGDGYIAGASVDGFFEVSYEIFNDIGQRIDFNITKINDELKREIEIAIRSVGASKEDAEALLDLLDREVARISDMVNCNNGYSYPKIEYNINNILKSKDHCVNAKFSVFDNDMSTFNLELSINSAFNTAKSRYALESGLGFETYWYGYDIYDIENKFNIYHKFMSNGEEIRITIEDNTLDNISLNKQIDLILDYLKDSDGELSEYIKDLKGRLKNPNSFEFDDTGCYEFDTEKAIGEYIVSAYIEDEEYHETPLVSVSIKKKL